MWWGIADMFVCGWQCSWNMYTTVVVIDLSSTGGVVGDSILVHIDKIYGCMFCLTLCGFGKNTACSADAFMTFF